MSRSLAILLISLLLTSAAYCQTEDAEAPAEPPAVEQPAEPPADEKSDETNDKKWETTFTPVIWLANTTTTVEVGNRTLSQTLRASDALSDFEAGGSGRLEFSNGQWGGFADLFFINLGETVNAGPRGNVPVKIGVDNFLWQVAGTYRVINKEDFDLDILAGARGYSLDVDVSVQPFVGPGGNFVVPGRFASRDISFTDPIIGAKGAWKLSEHWGFDLYGDIGGFGAGSDFTWRLGAGLDYSLNKTVSLRGGYTVIDFDYSKGSGFDKVRYETTMYGPTLGAGFKF